jgi:hypothetical protein
MVSARAAVDGHAELPRYKGNGADFRHDQRERQQAPQGCGLLAANVERILTALAGREVLASYRGRRIHQVKY